MDNSENTPTPQDPQSEEQSTEQEIAPLTEDSASIVFEEEPEPKRERMFSLRQVVFFACILLATAILLTYTLTASLLRRSYTEQLLAQQAVIEQINSASSEAANNLQLLEAVIEAYSYYADTLDEEAMLEAAFKAYVEASGDLYAQYYTEEEYQELIQSNNAELFGIGVEVISETFTVNDREYKGFRINRIYDGSSALEVDVRVGDLIYAIQTDGVLKTVSELGYTAAKNAIRGEENTKVTVGICRQEDGSDTFFEAELTRRKFETRSVAYDYLEGNREVGIVRISSFDLKTPAQFKQTVNELLADGVKYFVFDVRDNPGGDLRSIKAVMSYFLQKGDLVLESINRKGEVAASYVAEAVSYEGDYADCSVAESEIGMYRELNMVVLCNENTASAAEVFTATMQDYGLAPVVGMQTYGKGVMQSTRKIPFGNIVGYIKLTTYAYRTKRGVSYHGEGITPDQTAELSEEAKKYSAQILPQELDNQLKTAVQLMLTANQ